MHTAGLAGEIVQAGEASHLPEWRRIEHRHDLADHLVS
jgi:hypothetical protein